MKLIVAALVGTSLLATGPEAGATIQPGDALEACTLGWLYDGRDGTAYFSTASHCFDGAQDDKASLAGGERLGVVRARGDSAEAATDIALIAVDAALRPRTLGTMRGHPAIPSAAVGPAPLDIGSALQFSGHGDGVHLTAETRERRQGRITAGSTAMFWRGIAPIVFGDSGGPVAETGTGRALGLVKGAQFSFRPDDPGGGNVGPTVEATLALARRHGLALTLRLAGQGPPPVPSAVAPPGAAMPAQAPAAQRPRRISAARRRAACRRAARRVRRASKRRAALRRCARVR